MDGRFLVLDWINELQIDIFQRQRLPFRIVAGGAVQNMNEAVLGLNKTNIGSNLHQVIEIPGMRFFSHGPQLWLLESEMPDNQLLVQKGDKSYPHLGVRSGEEVGAVFVLDHQF